MTSVVVTRGRDAAVLVPAAAAAAVVVGVAAAAAPLLATAGLAVVVLVLAVVRRPATAAYLTIGLTPLLAGIDRGTLVPVLRPNEALDVLLAGALCLGFLLRPARGRSSRTARAGGTGDAGDGARRVGPAAGLDGAETGGGHGRRRAVRAGPVEVPRGLPHRPGVRAHRHRGTAVPVGLARGRRSGRRRRPGAGLRRVRGAESSRAVLRRQRQRCRRVHRSGQLDAGAAGSDGRPHVPQPGDRRRPDARVRTAPAAARHGRGPVLLRRPVLG